MTTLISRPAMKRKNKGRAPEKGLASRFTKKEMRRIADAAEVKHCGEDCPVIRTCKCKGECVHQERDDAEYHLERVRGRYRWERRKRDRAPTGEPCKCCREECNCIPLLACKHYEDLPANLTMQELSSILRRRETATFRDPEVEPEQAIALNREARVAIMEDRETLGERLRRKIDPPDVWLDLPDTVAMTPNGEIVPDNADEDEIPFEGTPEEIRAEARAHGQAVAARLDAISRDLKS